MRLAGIGIVLQLATFMVFAQVGETPPAPVPEVDLFSPQGEMRGDRQATARFSVPMVALGDPQLGSIHRELPQSRQRPMGRCPQLGL